MTIFSGICELCYPADECTCEKCQCKWCRDVRGDEVTPLERRMIDRHVAEVNAASQRAAFCKGATP
jgi:hypothetical protein